MTEKLILANLRNFYENVGKNSLIACSEAEATPLSESRVLKNIRLHGGAVEQFLRFKFYRQLRRFSV